MCAALWLLSLLEASGAVFGGATGEEHAVVKDSTESWAEFGNGSSLFGGRAEEGCGSRELNEEWKFERGMSRGGRDGMKGRRCLAGELVERKSEGPGGSDIGQHEPRRCLERGGMRRKRVSRGWRGRRTRRKGSNE